MVYSESQKMIIMKDCEILLHPLNVDIKLKTHWWHKFKPHCKKLLYHHWTKIRGDSKMLDAYNLSPLIYCASTHDWWQHSKLCKSCYLISSETSKAIKQQLSGSKSIKRLNILNITDTVVITTWWQDNYLEQETRHFNETFGWNHFIANMKIAEGLKRLI